DDFLSKPLDDIALFARVRSLVRLKMTIDEWIARENTASELGLIEDKPTLINELSTDAKVLVIEDKSFEISKISEALAVDNDEVVSFAKGDEALEYINNNDLDVIIVSLDIKNEDGLRLCSQLRSNERSRSVPVLTVAEDVDMRIVAKALEMGAHDYMLRPVDKNEILARVRTQVRRKRYQNRLRDDYEKSLTLAVKDTLTGLYNRRYLMTHLTKLLEKNATTKKSLCVMMLDIDHFKAVNDTHGHDVGDEVLQTFSRRIKRCIRSIDLATRMGGEEFFVVLPDVNSNIAIQVAERIRTDICTRPFEVSTDSGEISISVSIGAFLIASDNTVSVDEAIKTADEELYQAKESGRNRVYFKGQGCVTISDDFI
ncbi:MAG: diguanylate cyclase, partial [Proteobacteria bacterium]|nr:diguanylate cyclase [Pseudomonadota bacterium]